MVTYATIANNVVAGTATAAVCLIVCAAITAGTVAVGIAVTNIVVIVHIVVATKKKTIGRAAENYRGHHLTCPSAGNKPSVTPGSSSSSPSSACGYQNKAYCGTP